MKYIVKYEKVYDGNVVEIKDGSISVQIDENGILSYLEPCD